MARRWQLAATAGVVLLSVGCAAVAGESGAPVVTSPGEAGPTAGATATVEPNLGTTRPPDRPPDASLAADGDDAVVGQLGSYTWDGGGSDSPWLPGAPITVGPGEPLTVRVAGDIAVVSWTARRTPGDATSDSGAVAIGEGATAIAFAAPGPGDWTIEVTVRFAGGGSAAYAWRVNVR